MRLLRIDLDLPPERRWAPMAAHAADARVLVEQALTDLGPTGQAGLELVEEAAAAVLPEETRAELAALAPLLGVPLPRLLVGNLLYDLLKPALGCSAYAVETPAGPLHARNLDWWMPGTLLQDTTLVLDCQRRGRTRYRLVGWPGFLGCFSGVAPGRFAVTLNAVLGEDPPRLDEPAVFLLRRALDTAPDFDAAVRLLAETPIASDCLLLVSGPRAGERVVVERAPRRCSLRRPEDGVLEVTNGYRSLHAPPGGAGPLAATSDGRSARMRALLGAGRGGTVTDAWEVLGDPEVRLSCTVQQMVFVAATGEVQVRQPGLAGC